MAGYEEKLLTMLVEKYRKSKKDAGVNVIVRRTKIKPAQLYTKYDHNNGDMDQIEAVNQAVFACRQRGFVDFEIAGFSNEIKDIWLVDDKVDETEQYLEQTYGYESKASKRRYVEQMIGRYTGRTPVAERECDRLRAALGKNQIPPGYRQTEDLLKALVFIEENEKELFVREASMLIFGDSKYLEENVLPQVCRALRAGRERPCGADEVEDEILEKYHIFREKQKLCLKGNVSVQIAGRESLMGLFENGVTFFAEDLPRMECVHVNTPVFMTVENYTSWLRMKNPDMTLFYLGGYTTRSQRDFLKKIYKDNPSLTYLHFGDIDAGGMYIHEHLCRVTGIPFQMYRMSTKELTDKRFGSCLHTLTSQDRLRLGSLVKLEAYREAAEYMLAHDVKLEQEIISYYGG